MSGSNPTRRSEHGSSGFGGETEAPGVGDGGCDYGDDVGDVDCTQEPAWCVELGSSLAAMSTAEIVAAVGAGHISAAARVWAEGLECWTRIYDVPELFEQLFGVEADLATPPAVEIASGGSASYGAPAWNDRGVAPVEAPFAAAGLHRTSASQTHTPRDGTPSPAPMARSVRFGDAAAANPGRARRKLGPALALKGGDAGWIAAGLCVAAAAIGVALLQGPSSPAPELARAEHRLGVVEHVAEAARAGAAAGARAAAGPRAAVAPVAPAALVAPIAPINRAAVSRSEPGQRRLRGGAGRPSQAITRRTGTQTSP